MQPNSLIIIMAAGITLAILLTALFVLSRSLGAPTKEKQRRLTRFKHRFSGNEQSRAEAGRSIRVAQSSSGIGAHLAALLPRSEQIQIRLQKAGMEIPLSRYGTVCAAIAVGVFLLFLLLDWPLLLSLMMALLLGVGGPHFYVSRKIAGRMARFTTQFPEAMDLMVRGLKSGLPVNECIANVSQELPAPTGTEFRKITDAMRLGKQLEEALWDTAARLDTPDFKFFVISLVVQRETGGNLGETLGNLSTILRQRQGMKLKVKAMSSEAKASAWIVGVLPFIMLSLIMMLNYDYGIILFTHPKAIVAGIGALIWMSIGMLVMGKMVRFEV